MTLVAWEIDSVACAGTRIVVGGEGHLAVMEADGTLLSDAADTATQIAWSGATGRIYSSSSNTLTARDLLADGSLGEPVAAPIVQTEPPTLVVSPDGTRVLAGTLLADAETLEGHQVGAFADAAWTNFGGFELFSSFITFEPMLALLDESFAPVFEAPAAQAFENAFLAAEPDRMVLIQRSQVGLSFVVYPEDDRDGDGLFDAADRFPDDPSEWLDRDGDGVGDVADAFPDDYFEWRDFDGDGIGDHSDPFPIGEPFLSFALDGQSRITIAGLGSGTTRLGGHLGFLPSGVFSLCDDGSCMFGEQTWSDAKGVRYVLQPDPAFLTAAEQSFDVSLRRAFRRSVTIDLHFKPETLVFDVKMNAKGTRAKIRFRVAYTAIADGAPRSFRSFHGVWSWKFEPAVAVATP